MGTDVHDCPSWKLRPIVFLCGPLSKRRKLQEYLPHVKMTIAPSCSLSHDKMRRSKCAFQSGPSKRSRCVIFSSAFLLFSMFFCTLAKTLSHFCRGSEWDPRAARRVLSLCWNAVSASRTEVRFSREQLQSWGQVRAGSEKYNPK